MNYCSKNQAIKCNFQSIDLAITDARSNLLDSLRFASHDRAHGISIVFGGKVIAGTTTICVRLWLRATISRFVSARQNPQRKSLR